MDETPSNPNLYSINPRIGGITDKVIFIKQ
jgi:hypothetical protein